MCLLTGAALALETLAGQTLWIARLEAGGAAPLRARLRLVGAGQQEHAGAGRRHWRCRSRMRSATRAAQGDAAAHDPPRCWPSHVGLPVAFKLAAAALALPRHRKEIAA